MKAKGNIMVCVTVQRSCNHLIERGIERARDFPGSELHVVHCVETGRNFMNNPDEADAIEYLFTAAQLAGGQLSLLRADDVDDALVEYAARNGVGLIILGEAGNIKSGREPIAVRLGRRLPETEFDVVSSAG